MQNFPSSVHVPCTFFAKEICHTIRHRFSPGPSSAAPEPCGAARGTDGSTTKDLLRRGGRSSQVKQHAQSSVGQ
jgi:hypothetical protein